jgi:hypothetical protein
VIVPSSVSIVTSPTLTSSGAWIVTPPASIFSGISIGESVSTVTPEPQPTRAAAESAMSKIANFLKLFSFTRGVPQTGLPPTTYTAEHAQGCRLSGSEGAGRGAAHVEAPSRRRPLGSVKLSAAIGEGVAGKKYAYL